METITEEEDGPMQVLLSRRASSPYAGHSRDTDVGTALEYSDWCNGHSAMNRSLRHFSKLISLRQEKGRDV